MMKKKISFSVYSDIGKRDVNEDSYKAINTEVGYGFVVCDGLGGHGMGDVASSMVTSIFEKCFMEYRDIKSFLSHFFENAQSELLAEQKRFNAETKMKTTAVALVMNANKAYIGHIGDSRLYVFFEDKVVKRTLDHSLPQMMVLTKEISECEIRNHPDRNIVFRVLGTPWGRNEKYEIMKPIPIKKCQAFLLCTDGFWEQIEEKEMCEHLKTSRSAEEWLNKMKEHVKQVGSSKELDNNTAVAVWCE